MGYRKKAQDGVNAGSGWPGITVTWGSASSRAMSRLQCKRRVAIGKTVTMKGLITRSETVPWTVASTSSGHILLNEADAEGDSAASGVRLPYDLVSNTGA